MLLRLNNSGPHFNQFKSGDDFLDLRVLKAGSGCGAEDVVELDVVLRDRTAIDLRPGPTQHDLGGLKSGNE